MANLRNESRFYKKKNTPKQKVAQNNVGGKIPKRGPKQLLKKKKKLSNLRPDKLTQL